MNPFLCRSILLLLPQRRQSGDIRLIHGSDMGGSIHGFHHCTRNGLPHPTERHPLHVPVHVVFSRRLDHCHLLRGFFLLLFSRLLHVLLDNTPPGSGSLDRCEIDVQLPCQPPHCWHSEDLNPLCRTLGHCLGGSSLFLFLNFFRGLLQHSHNTHRWALLGFLGFCLSLRFRHNLGFCRSLRFCHSLGFFSLLPDDQDNLPHLNRFPLGRAYLENHSLPGGWYFKHGFIRLHLDEHLVLFDGVSFVYHPLNDLALRQSLA